MAAAKELLSRADEAQARRLFDLGKFYLRPLTHRPAAARRYLYDALRTYAGTAQFDMWCSSSRESERRASTGR